MLSTIANCTKVRNLQLFMHNTRLELEGSELKYTEMRGKNIVLHLCKCVYFQISKNVYSREDYSLRFITFSLFPSLSVCLARVRIFWR